MNIPKDLLYTKSHEWARILPSGNAQIGLTDHAQHKLGDIVFANLNVVGDSVIAGKAIGDVESIKAVSEVYSALNGVIAKVNSAVSDNPSLINSEPYETWLVELTNISGKETLMSAAEYEQIVSADA